MSTAPTARAIETRYRGHRYRSRLEARWAVFFDAAGIPFDYEPEGFELRDGEGTLVRYLPDFWLPEQQCWVEIKGAEPTSAEMEKAWLLQEATAKEVWIFAGNIVVPDEHTPPLAGITIVRVPQLDDEWVQGKPFYWTECPWCNKLDICSDGSLLALPCQCPHDLIHSGFLDLFSRSMPGGGEPPTPQETWLAAKFGAFERCWDSPRLITAYRAASYARFEYGEAGR